MHMDAKKIVGMHWRQKRTCVDAALMPIN